AEALPHAVAKRLGVIEAQLQNLTVFKRSYDARKKNTEIKFIYIIDVALANEAAVLTRLADDRHIRPSPDTQYYPVAQAPAELKERPVVIGLGPCGLYAALILAQMGFK